MSVKELIAQVFMNVATIAIVMYVFAIQMNSMKADITTIKQNMPKSDATARAPSCLDTTKPNVKRMMNGSDICYCVSNGGSTSEAVQSIPISSDHTSQQGVNHKDDLAVPLTMDPEVADSLMNAVEEVSSNMQSVEPFMDYDETMYYIL